MWREQRLERAAGRSSTGRQTDSSLDRPSEGWSTHPTATARKETRQEGPHLTNPNLKCVIQCMHISQIIQQIQENSWCTTYLAGNKINIFLHILLDRIIYCIIIYILLYWIRANLIPFHVEQTPPSSSSKGSRSQRSSDPAWGILCHWNTNSLSYHRDNNLNLGLLELGAWNQNCYSLHQSPGSVGHLVGVVVQSYDGLSLLYAGEDYHQSSVCHHQFQVVLGQIKVHSLTKKTPKKHRVGNNSLSIKQTWRIALKV